MQELCPEVARAQEQLTHRNGRRPSLPEIASYLGVTVAEVEQAALSTAVYSPVSLDAPVRAEEPDGDPSVSSWARKTRDSGAALILALRPAVRELPARERELLRLRFWGECTQAEIGERMGISQMHVARLLRQIIERLRAQVEA